MRRSLTLLLVAALLLLPSQVLGQSLVNNNETIDCPLPVSGLDGTVEMPADAPLECLAVTTSEAPLFEGPFFEAAFVGIVTGDEIGRSAFDVAGVISYREGQINASVGCNQIFGPADLIIAEPSRLVPLAPFGSTLMYCEGLMEAEAALLRILGGGELTLGPDGISNGSGLIRVPGGVAIAMPAVVPTPEMPRPCVVSSKTGCAAALPDGATTIRGIRQGEATLRVESGWIRLVDGRLSASVGCNSIGGEYRLAADGTLTVDSLVSTEMACAGLMEIESALLAVLNGGGLRLEASEIIGDAGVVILESAPGSAITETASGSGAGASFAWLLLLFPLAAAAVAIAIGLSSARETETRR